MAQVVFRGSRQDVSRVMRTVAAVLAGSGQDTHGIGKGFLTAIGFGALSDVKTAFVAKARGGTDEMGIKWPSLSPATIANRRVGAKDKRENVDIAEREKIRKRETAKALKRFRLSLPEDEAQRRARIVGGLKATRQTGKLKVDALGGRNVEILRDTGVLFNSLSPGQLVRGGGGNLTYSKPTREGGDEQTFELSPPVEPLSAAP